MHTFLGYSMFTDTHAYFFMKKVCDKFLWSRQLPLVADLHKRVLGTLGSVLRSNSILEVETCRTPNLTQR